MINIIQSPPYEKQTVGDKSNLDNSELLLRHRVLRHLVHYYPGDGGAGDGGSDDGDGAYRSPWVEGDKFVTKFGDSPQKSQNLVIFLSTILMNPSHFHHIW